MTDQKPPELFAERPVRSDFGRSSGPSYMLRRIMTLAILATVVGAGAYWGFVHKSAVKTPEEIPTIKSEGNYKERPEQPGGLDIPHQDVQVYQEIDGAPKSDKPEVEHLLPPPEQPIAPAATQPLQKTDNVAPPLKSLTSSAAAPSEAIMPITPHAVATTVTQAVVQPAPAPTPQPVQATPSAPAPAPVATVQQQHVAAPVTAPSPTPAVTAAPKTIDQVIKNVTTKNKATTGSTAVQLASLPDQNAAQSMATKLQGQYSSVLNGATLHVVRADLGAKGIYYRIQSQPLSDDQAKSICSSIKNMKAGCILVHP